ncbi:MAG: hypothetical protein ACM3MG_00740 [Bacillota bacterium]
MKFFLALTALTFALAGCNVQEENKKDGQTDTMVNQTDYTACQAGSTSPATPAGLWKAAYSQGNYSFVRTYNIGNNFFQLTHECNFNGTKVSTSAGAGASIYFGKIAVLGDQRTEKSISREGYKLTCQAEVTGGNLNYHYQGACLVLTDENNTNEIMLVPVSQ